MSIEKFAIARDDSLYHAWPDITLAGEERLVCVFSECTHHGDRSYTRIMFTLSDDRGRTWSQKMPLSDARDGEPFWNCARISRLKDGRLTANADLCKKHENRGSLSDMENHLWFSSDNGLTWDGPHLMEGVYGIVPDQIIELSDGRLTVGAHHGDRKKDLWTQRYWFSSDQGKTWGEPVIVAEKKGLQLCESSLIESPNGELVCFMRENSFKGLPAYKTVSADRGKTWSDLYTYPVPGCHRPVCGLLKSGDMLMTCRLHQGASPYPKTRSGFGWAQMTFAVLGDVESITARHDGGALRIFPVDYDRAIESDTGYTGWTQFEDGEIYIVNYIIDDAPKGQIRGYSLYEEDLYIAK